MEWNAGKHDTLFTTCSQRAKTTSFFVQLCTCWQCGQVNFGVFFGSGPELFVDGLAGRRQLGRSRASNKYSLNYGAGFYFSVRQVFKKLVYQSR